MTEFLATLRLFALAVLISFSLAAGAAALGTMARAHDAAPAAAVSAD